MKRPARCHMPARPDVVSAALAEASRPMEATL